MLILKKTYVTETVFDENHLIQIIEAANKGVHANFIDKQQYEDTYDDKGSSLVDIFKNGGYYLEYLGRDSLGSHLFNITNNDHTIEIIMNDALFSAHFTST